MLKDDLYIIQKVIGQNNSIEVFIELNEQHAIFKGHFPGHPVLPGACMLQMTKELLEDFFKLKLQLIKADDIRFLTIIDPAENKILQFFIQYNPDEAPSIKISAKILKNEAIICCKLKAAFEIIS